MQGHSRVAEWLKTWDLRKLGNVRKASSWNENFVATSKNLLKNRNWIFPVILYFTRIIEFVSNILWMIVVYQVYFFKVCQSDVVLIFLPTSFSYSTNEYLKCNLELKWNNLLIWNDSLNLISWETFSWMSGVWLVKISH